MLELRIVTSGNVPIYRQIVEHVRMGAITGAYPAGEPLPSVRVLAEQLVVNPNTVAHAYAELVRDGVIESRPGKGCFVAERRQMYSRSERTRRLEEAMNTLANEALFLGFTPDEICRALARKLESLPAQKAAQPVDSATSAKRPEQGGS